MDESAVAGDATVAINAHLSLADAGESYRLFSVDHDFSAAFEAPGFMAAAAVLHIAVPPVFHEHGRGFADVRALNDRLIELRDRGLVRGVVGIADPKCGALTAHELDRLKSVGALGVVSSARAQGLFVDDLLMVRHLEAAAERQLVSLIYTSPYSTNAALWRILNLCERVPEAPVLVLGALASWDDVALLTTRIARLPNIHFDTSGIGHAFYIAQLAKVLGDERLLFGAGNAADRGSSLIAKICGQQIAASTKSSILRDNAARLFGIEVAR